jgi:hypothetical protein
MSRADTIIDKFDEGIFSAARDFFKGGKDNAEPKISKKTDGDTDWKKLSSEEMLDLAMKAKGGDHLGAIYYLSVVAKEFRRDLLTYHKVTNAIRLAKKHRDD